MKKWMFALLLLLLGVFLVVPQLLSMLSTTVITHVTEELMTDDVMEELMSDPQIQQIVAEYADTSSVTKESIDALPFATKEEGLKVIISKFSPGELKDLAQIAKNGVSEEEKEQLITTYKERFTEDEVKALLIIGLAEGWNEK